MNKFFFLRMLSFMVLTLLTAFGIVECMSIAAQLGNQPSDIAVLLGVMVGICAPFVLIQLWFLVFNRFFKEMF